VLALVFLLLLGFAGWFYLGGTLRAEMSVRTASAAEYPEAFAAIRDLVNAHQAPQALGSEGVRESPGGYTLVDVTVTLWNRGLFPAEWLHVTAGGIPGDVAVYALTGEGGDIAPRDSGEVNLKLITTASADAQRDISIEYYVHGMKRAITVR